MQRCSWCQNLQAALNLPLKVPVQFSSNATHKALKSSTFFLILFISLETPWNLSQDGFEELYWDMQTNDIYNEQTQY